MANIIIGTNDAMGTASSRPISVRPQPHWNTATTTPYAAPIDNRFNRAALRGTRMERNTIINNRNDSETMAPMNHNSRDEIDDIAANADIAPRTFFYYFPTKEDVVLADYANRLERLTAELAQQPDTDAPWKALRAAFAIVAGDYVAKRDELVRRLEIMASNLSVDARSLQLQARWEDALADVLARRAQKDSDDLTSRLMASAALACMRAALRHWLLTTTTPCPS